MTSIRKTLCVLTACLTPLTLLADPAVKVRTIQHGELEGGRSLEEYRLLSPSGHEVRILNLGATLHRVRVPDRNGKIDDVTLYLDRPQDYAKGHPLFGSIVGRYANRIAGGSFTIDGKEHVLERNVGGRDHIHGGRQGFQKRLWKGSTSSEAGRASVVLEYTSANGEAGFPGRLETRVTYTLDTTGTLRLEYLAKTDRPTHVNLTQHAYWNLAGAGSGDVLDHVLRLHASRVLEADGRRFPTGKILPVEGTPLDFRQPRRIGERVKEAEGENYDDCFVIDPGEGPAPRPAARLVDPSTGRVLEVLTTQPGVQVYTAKGLGPRWKSSAGTYGPYHGVCLETQHFPDSPGHPHFPSTLLRPGETYRHVTLFRFGIAER